MDGKTTVQFTKSKSFLLNETLVNRWFKDNKYIKPELKLLYEIWLEFLKGTL